MARNFDVSLIRSFVVAADRASMTEAANVLHVTQGAISQQIRRLEEMVGSALFARDRRGLRLTASGERLLGKARHLLSVNDEIWAEMTATRVEGAVRLGAPYDLVGVCVAPVLKAYAEAYPQVAISLVCGSSPELMDGLARGAIDLAVVEEEPGVSRAECLGVERLVWAGARAGSAHLKRPLPISLVAETCAFRPAVLAALHDHGMPWRTMFENGSIEATTATVRADLAITAWLAFTVPADLDILTVEAGLPVLPPFAINLHLPRHQISPAAAELVRFIREGLIRPRPEGWGAAFTPAERPGWRRAGLRR